VTILWVVETITEDEMYRSDHIKVLKVLAGALPKRPTFKTKDVVAKAFKRAEGGDRRVRNAYRKIRKEGHAEIADRGEYRLTASGGAFCNKLSKDGWKVPEEEKKAATKKTTKKKAAKKVAKKAAPKAAAKKATSKKTAKKASAKKTNSKKKAPARKAAAKKSPKKSGQEAKSGSNGVNKGNGTTEDKDASAGATLSF
jgi:hypothetical protein